jgi:hypothetical protein
VLKKKYLGKDTHTEEVRAFLILAASFTAGLLPKYGSVMKEVRMSNSTVALCEG